ncbi:zinc finger protein 525-like [Trichoplusia ni]|uniref:Zinc finger protein 525-like n=1 Tax=Trichoplusia ni TaxID=7111 RepID=A0A7E5X591_TRINI|nr:zinc finger protein 525-like [Trichoplusia ni]
MAEANQTNPVFIDVASGSNQYPINVVSEANNEVQEIKVDKDVDSTSDPYLNIQSRRIRCPECSRFSAETEEKMLRHIRKIHRGENPFQCCMCEYSTYNKILFEEHVRIHQGIKPYKCSHCPYRSVSKKNTKKHEQIHRSDNPHKCEHCGFIARHLRALNHHLLTHGQKNAYKCLKCKESFASQSLLETHRNIKKRCPECSELLCYKLYKSHRQEVHGVAIKKKKTAPKETKFVCAICKWEGIHKPRILLHLIHHPNQEVDETVVDTQILRKLGIMGQTEAET